ncbi:MAG TPA: hypothetical protein VK599_20375 [Streptosporangiaceae bacterium]|nr:hypothetical protein [Streptosporangiaceae bacterium]
MGVTYKYFGAPDRATAARVPTALGRDGLGLDAGELGTLGRLGELFGQDGREARGTSRSAAGSPPRSSRRR